MHTCWKCKSEKEINDENFYRNRSVPRGYGYACKTCADEIAKESVKRKRQKEEAS